MAASQQGNSQNPQVVGRDPAQVDIVVGPWQLAAAGEAGIDLYVHAPYLINVATTNNRIRIAYVNGAYLLSEAELGRRLQKQLLHQGVILPAKIKKLRQSGSFEFS